MQQQLVQLTVAPDPAQVAPGALLPIALSVHNATRDVLRGRIVARGLEGGWSELSTPLTVAPDATVRATLALRPDASLREGHYPLTVAVMAEDDRTVYATTTVDLRVGDDATVVMDVQPAEVEGPSGAFLVTAYNGTRWISTIELTVRDRDGGALNVSITPRDLLVVLPGAAVTAQARVTPAREAREEPETAPGRVYEIEVLGLQTGQSASQSGPSLRREVRFVYAPRSGGARAGRMVGLPLLGRGAALWIAVSGVLLALLLVIGMRVFTGGGFAAAPTATPTRTAAHTRTATTTTSTPTPAGRGIAGHASPTPRATATAAATSTPVAPRIGQFTLAQRRHDAPYLLVWRTSHATMVTLNGKPVASSGQFRPPWPLKDATYRLVAGTGTRRTTRQLQVAVDASGADHYAGQSIRLSRPRVIAFTLVRRGGALYAAWQVSNAPQARLQGQPVYEAGERIVPRGATTVTLHLANAVGITQRVLRVPVVPPMPTPTPRPTATATPMPTPTPRPTATATATATPLPTVTATPLPSPTAMPRPTKTPRPTATATATATPLPPTATVTPSPTATATPLPTATATPLPSPTATPRPTKTPAATATATAHPTRTPRPTATATARPTKTPRPTATAPPRPTETPRPTATATASPTRTPTATPRPTRTPKPTATATARPTRTPRPTATATPSPTKTPRPTATPRPTRTPRPTAIPAPTATMIALPTGQIIPPTPRSRAARPIAAPRPTATPTVPPTPTRTPRPTATDTATPQPTATRQQGAIGTIAPNVLLPTATPPQ